MLVIGKDCLPRMKSFIEDVANVYSESKVKEKMLN